MGYYDEKNKMQIALEALVKQSESGIEEIFVIFDLTKRFKIGEKTIQKRIDMYVNLGMVERFGELLRWVDNKKGGRKK